MLLYGLDIWHVSWLHMHMHMHMNMRPSVNKSSPNTTHMKSVFSARDRVRLAKLQSPRLRPCWLLQKIHVQRHPWRDHSEITSGRDAWGRPCLSHMARHPAGRGRARPRAPRGAGQPGADGSGAARRAAAYAAAPRGWWEGRLLTRYLDYLALPLNLVTLCC